MSSPPSTTMYPWLMADQLQNHPDVSELFYAKDSPTQQIHDRYKQPEESRGNFVLGQFVHPGAAIVFYIY